MCFANFACLGRRKELAVAENVLFAFACYFHLAFVFGVGGQGTILSVLDVGKGALDISSMIF